MNDKNGLTIDMVSSLLSEMCAMGGEPHINAVRFMKAKEDVDYAHHADEVEVSVHAESGNVRYFVWDFNRPQDGWIETV